MTNSPREQTETETALMQSAADVPVPGTVTMLPDVCMRCGCLSGYATSDEAQPVLCTTFKRYVTEHGLGGQIGDAEDLLRRTDLTPEQRRWLTDFVVRWDAMSKARPGTYTTLTQGQWHAFERVSALAISAAKTDEDRNYCHMFDDFLVNESEEQE